MKYDNEYLKNLYNTTPLPTFLSMVDVENIPDLRIRAIIGALQRSIRALHLEFNPLPEKEIPEEAKSQG